MNLKKYSFNSWRKRKTAKKKSFKTSKKLDKTLIRKTPNLKYLEDPTSFITPKKVSQP